MRIRMENRTDPDTGNLLRLEIDSQDSDDWTAHFSDGGMLLRFDLGAEEIIELCEQLERSRFLEHYYEMKAERRAFERGETPPGVAADDDSSGYALDDPKHPTYHERMVGDA